MINALVYTEELEQKGFSPEQAKAAVKIWLELMNSEFATKSDLDAGLSKLRGELKSDISDVKAELKADISELKMEVKRIDFKFDKKIDSLESKLTIKLGSLMVIGIGIIATMIKFGG